MVVTYNFSAGPAALPAAVMEQAQAEFLDWQGTGVSVMSLSHRDPRFLAMAAQAEMDLRELLQIPAHYRVLFVAGSASHQFAMVPMNLLRGKAQADYIDSGIWAQKALQEARRYCQVKCIATWQAEPLGIMTPFSAWQPTSDAAYVHYTANETISGLEFADIPPITDVPLVSDMSSNLLARPLAVERFGLIYASAQKNISISGLTLVIVREDLLGQVLDATPTLYNYQVLAEHASLYNTPPTYAWYLAGLVFAWLKQQGGLAVMAEHNQRKAALLYQYIDQSGFYYNHIDPAWRSQMNVTFTLARADLTLEFVQQAAAAGLVGLKGHRLVGGIRASLYNAMPLAGVKRLIDFMQEFAHQHS